MLDYVPGPFTTWATYGIFTDILEKFWRDWDRVTIFFRVGSADGRQGYGDGFVATKEMFEEITGRGWHE